MNEYRKNNYIKMLISQCKTLKDRMLQAQDYMPESGLGNLIALPLQGQALKNGNSSFIDEKWNAFRKEDCRQAGRSISVLFCATVVKYTLKDLSKMSRNITGFYAENIGMEQI